MPQLTEIVDSLENRISKLLHRYKNLKHENLKLEEELITYKAQIKQSNDEIELCKEKIESLQLTNSLLGSDQFKRETKLKINMLIREIDQCIAHLSE